MIWMNSVEDTVQMLETQTMSTQEYKGTVAKFQVSLEKLLIYILSHETLRICLYFKQISGETWKDIDSHIIS